MSVAPRPRRIGAWPHADRTRARLLVALAGATWLPWVWKYLWADPAYDPVLSLLLIGVTLLPLAVRGQLGFRRTCWTVAGLMVFAALATGPYAIIMLPLGAVLCPAAVLLLIAARESVGRTAAVVGVLAALPSLLLTIARFSTSGPG
ncbi:hypothetical protein GCM10009665_75450 [Kitasatospora nipponensis]|uniref:Uncharacterized protein n=1 Tax=Kitasatospora nipponensis TaxID=258049 RepID=A0ABN1T7K0_9ACTN